LLIDNFFSPSMKPCTPKMFEAAAPNNNSA